MLNIPYLPNGDVFYAYEYHHLVKETTDLIYIHKNPKMASRVIENNIKNRYVVNNKFIVLKYLDFLKMYINSKYQKVFLLGEVIPIFNKNTVQYYSLVNPDISKYNNTTIFYEYDMKIKGSFIKKNYDIKYLFNIYKPIHYSEGYLKSNKKNINESNILSEFGTYIYKPTERFDPYPRLFMECSYFNKKIEIDGNFKHNDGANHFYSEYLKGWDDKRLLTKDDEIIKEFL